MSRQDAGTTPSQRRVPPSTTLRALREAEAARQRSQPPAGAEHKPRESSGGDSWGGLLLSSIGIVLGCGLFLACLLFFAASIYFSVVLSEISQRDFSSQIERINHYEVLFEAVAKAGYEVQRDEPRISEGVTTYFWTVSPRGSDDIRPFKWEHNLASMELTPMTNPALYVDIELGYLTEDEARNYRFYDPEDKLCLAIVNTDFSLFAPSENAQGWLRAPAPEGPVLAPLITPEEALKRRGGAVAEEEPVEEQPAEDGTVPPDSQAIEVGGEQTPPADGAEPPVEVGNGDGDTGGGGGGAGDGDGGDGGGSGDDGGGGGDSDGDTPPADE